MNREGFWDAVDVGGLGNCWLWQMSCTAAGYGQVCVGGKMLYAHRLSYELFYMERPGDLHVLHSCDNPPCVNPLHLRLGTPAQNAADMMERRRHRYKVCTGADHPAAKLTEAAVIEARRLYREGGASIKSLAARYGVSGSTMAGVVRGKTWAHLPGAIEGCKRGQRLRISEAERRRRSERMRAYQESRKLGCDVQTLLDEGKAA